MKVSQKNQTRLDNRANTVHDSSLPAAANRRRGRTTEPLPRSRACLTSNAGAILWLCCCSLSVRHWILWSRLRQQRRELVRLRRKLCGNVARARRASQRTGSRHHAQDHGAFWISQVAWGRVSTRWDIGWDTVWLLCMWQLARPTAQRQWRMRLLSGKCAHMYNFAGLAFTPGWTAHRRTVDVCKLRLVNRSFCYAKTCVNVQR